MTSPVKSTSPTEWQVRRDQLRSFLDAYVPYIEATRDAVYEGHPVENTDERSRVFSLAALAEEAALAVGVTPIFYSHPHGPAKRAVTGLANVAFAHENPIFRTTATPLEPDSYPQPHDLTVDATRKAIALVESRHRSEQKRRRRPTYLIDCGLRSVLGFPGYLISLIFGFDRSDLGPGRKRALNAS